MHKTTLGLSGVQGMFGDVDHKVKKKFCRGMLLPVSLIIGATLAGCSASSIFPNSNDSAITHFGYTGSPLARIIVAGDKSVVASGAYFGMTIHRLAATPSSSKPAVPFPSFRVQTFRFWDVVNWAMLEPAEGQYDWTTMDETIAIAKQNGVRDFIFTVGYVPTWASSSPSNPCGSIQAFGSCNAPNMGAFDDFLTHVVRRYCGVVSYYETWNEPDDKNFWSGTNAQLVKIASDLNQIAKDPQNCGCTEAMCAPGGGVNPNHLVLPSISSINQSSLGWLDAYLASAGATYPYANIASFHGYGYIRPEDIVQGVGQLKKTLAKHGLSSLPLWDTEASWGTANADDQEQEASWLMRFHVTQALPGVSRFIWYAYDNCAWGTLWGPTCEQSSDDWQGVRLPGEAYATIESWMDGATLTHCDEYEDGLWACELQRAGGYEGWILWDSTGTGRSISIPPRLQLTQYRDWRNNLSPLPQEIEVDQMPIIVEN